MNLKGFQENFPLLWNEPLFAMCLIFMTQHQLRLASFVLSYSLFICNELKHFTPIFKIKFPFFRKLLSKANVKKPFEFQQFTYNTNLSLINTILRNPVIVLQMRLRSSHWWFIEIHLKKRVFSCRIVQVCVTFLLPPGILRLN